MGLEFYTGLTTTPGYSQKSDNFNKTAINSDSVKERIGFYGAHISSSRSFTVRTIKNGTSWIIPFDTLIYDNAGLWNPSTPNRLVFPAGFSYCEVSAYANYAAGNGELALYFNGDMSSAGQWTQVGGTTNQSRYYELHTNFFRCVAGNYIQLGFNPNTGSDAEWDKSMTNDYSGFSSLTVTNYASASLMLRCYK